MRPEEILGVVPIRNGGMGLSNVGPAGSVPTSDGNELRYQGGAFQPVMQIAWFVDEQNATGKASDRNDGKTPDTPLLTDSERVRRMGPKPSWVLPRYDLVYLSDADTVLLYGTRFGTCRQIWVHCSDTTGNPYQGQSILATAAAISARTAINEATNTRSVMTGGPANTWITNLANQNRRIRFVGGSVVGALCFAQKTGGGAVCNVSQWYLPATYNPVSLVAPTMVTPAVADTYVVEKLGTISSFVHAIFAADDAQATVAPVNCDSVNFGSISQLPGTDLIAFLGCTNVNATPDADAGGLRASAVLIGCATRGGGVRSGGIITVWMSHVCGEFFPTPGATVAFNLRTIAQGTTVLGTGSIGGSAAIFNLGVFDSPAVGIAVDAGPAYFYGPFWGSGNANASFFAGGGARGIVDTFGGGSVAQLTCTGSNDFSLGQVANTTARAFNDATGVYTAARNSTWANLAASVATTGFGGCAWDVFSGSGLVLL